MARLSERRRELLTSMMQDSIYEAVAAVLAEHGIRGMTMDRVAEQAEVAKGSLYNYFPNKQALLQFVHEKALAPVRQKGQEVLLADLPALEKLEAIILTWFEYLDEHRGLFSFLVADSDIRGMLKCEEDSGRASAVQDLATIIEQGIDEKVFRPVDPIRVAGFLFSAIRQVCDQQLSTDAPWPVKQLTKDLVDFFAHGLGVTSGSGAMQRVC